MLQTLYGITLTNKISNEYIHHMTEVEMIEEHLKEICVGWVMLEKVDKGKGHIIYK